MCFLNRAREEEAVSLVTRLTETHHGVTVQVLAFYRFPFYTGIDFKIRH